jgi:hypothetical protein
MRWTPVSKPRHWPIEGEQRRVVVFPLLPKKVRGEKRWFEFASISQVYHPAYSYNSTNIFGAPTTRISSSWWREVGWDDEYAPTTREKFRALLVVLRNLTITLCIVGAVGWFFGNGFYNMYDSYQRLQ